MSVNTWGFMVCGDKDAFLTLYQSHYRSLFRYGFSLSTQKELTKDCIQELFLEIWNKRATLNKDVHNVRAYLFTWLRRKISRELSLVAKEGFSRNRGQDHVYVQSSYEELLIAFQKSEEKKDQLKLALKQLTRKQLEIVRLKFYENLPYKAIADQTSLTTRTVYNLVYESIRSLRASMKILQVAIETEIV